MVSDSEIINRLKDYKPKFIDSNGNEIHRSILSSGNGKLLNVDNKFDENTLKLDTSINIKRHALNFIELSGLNSEDQTYQSVEPAALLTAQEGKSKFIEPIWSSDESFVGQKIQIEDNNSSLTFQKFYPTDYGELLDGTGHDIPQRQIMNSKDPITLGLHATTTAKKSFVIGSSQPQTPSQTPSITGKKCAIYLNEIINNYTIIPGVIYHGECEFFNYKFIPAIDDTTGNHTLISINNICEGKFIAKTYPSPPVVLQSEKKFNSYILMIRTEEGWSVEIFTDKFGIAILDFKSITDFEIMENYTGQFPLPVKLAHVRVPNTDNWKISPTAAVENYKNDVIKWTTNYNPPIAKIQNRLQNITLPLKSNKDKDRFIEIQNWNIDYYDNENSLEVNFEHQMIDNEQNNLSLDNNYYFEEILFKYQDEIEHISVNKSYIDRDPFNIKLKFKNVFYRSIEEEEESSNVQYN